MTTLKDAWDAIKQGDRLKAQEITAHILKDNPRNAEAWMALGEAVSGDRQALFYRKALQLDPTLESARERLFEIERNQQLGLSVSIPSVAPLPSNSGTPDVPEGVELDAPTVPLKERLAAEKAVPKTQSTAAMEARAKTSANPTIPESTNAPAVVKSESPAVSEEKTPKAKPTTQTDSKTEAGFDTNAILLLLVLVCMIIVGYLLYLTLFG